MTGKFLEKWGKKFIQSIYRWAVSDSCPSTRLCVSWAALGTRKAAILSGPQDISIPSASNYSCLQAYQSEHKYTVLSAYYTSCLRVFCLCLGCYIPGIKQLCSWLITQKVLCREICRKGVFEAEEESGFNAEFVFF